jgi:hypothetical protein
VANTLNLFRNGAVGFIDWLDPNVSCTMTDLDNLSIALSYNDVKAAASKSTRWRSAVYGPLATGQIAHIWSLISNGFLAIDRK